MPYHVYILRLENDNLYVGSTNNLSRRFGEHQSGSGCITTSTSPIIELLYFELHPDRQSALQREHQLKRWSHAKKLALANANLAHLKRLAKCRRLYPE